ncbi:MmcQ/YjbR family DNA-binding protein [Glutamicibacter sp. JL.03c]|uniref:MmcQ/YjbR family DNA-binding protein n=1 Tax=Glutamicibacter sp. JL.03c TaxID=2984842 RepID=UPI0021F78CC8|nr:MmcQ/YjbR family DNA-binding protein [Glutamicibacter sp. JL.03c]UYQ77907.1 MmcQ/YjbR family DNA-binding protein [Glutamicibacter sp. JL.03c]
MNNKGSQEPLEQQWAQLCLSMPCAFVDYPFGPESTVFKVFGRDRDKAKMFGLLMNVRGELVLNLKCEPALADQQRSEHPEITPGYHMNKKHWNSIRAGLDPELLLELIEDSYDLVVDGMPRRDKEYIRLQSTISQSALD